jgi:hypothetical protein
VVVARVKTANAVAQTRQDLIEDARRAVFDDLTSHDLFLAALALTQGAVPAFNDFMKMRGACSPAACTACG